MRTDLVEFYGIEATPELVRELRSAGATGVRLLRRNIEDPDQVRELTGALARELANLEFAVRHEGGAVTPFVRGVTAFPGLEALEAAAQPVLARDVGRAMGAELSAMGITANQISSPGPMASELAAGLREAGIRAGTGAVVRGRAPEADEREARELARAVARGAIRVERDPGRLLPLDRGRRVGLLVPRLGDVADRMAIPDEIRATASLLRPEVGAGSAVLELPLQPDADGLRMAAQWMEAQDAGVLLLFDAGRFEGQRRLLESVARSCRNLVVAILGAASDRSFVPEGASVVGTSGFQACQLRAMLEAIFEPPHAAPKRK